MDHPPGSVPQPAALPNYDPRIYEQLSTFTFGEPPAPSSSRTAALVAANGTSLPSVKSSGQPTDETDESMEELDEEERGRAERAKLRAMEDGSRRPSLPINIPPSTDRRRSTVFKLAGGIDSLHMDDVPEEKANETMSLPARLGAKPLPKLPLAPFHDLPAPSPLSQLPPRKDLHSKLEASAAAEGYDLNYIMDPEPDNASSPKMDSEASGASPPPTNGSDVRETSPPGGYMDSAGYQAILDHEWGTAFHIPGNISPRSSIMEDPFMKMVEQFDPVYNRNRYAWTFKKVPEPKKQQPAPVAEASSSTSQPVTNDASEDSIMVDRETEKGKGKEKEHTEVVVWNCQNVGQYGLWPGRTGTFLWWPFLDLLILCLSATNGEHRRPSVLYAISNEGSKRRGPTYLIHKHSRCHAFSIFQGYQVTGQKILAAHAMLLSSKAIQYSFANSPENKSSAKPRSHEPYENDPDVQKLQTHQLVEDDADTPPAHKQAHHNHIIQPQPQRYRGHSIHVNAGSPRQTPPRQSSATPERILSRKSSKDLLRHTPRAGPSSFNAAAEMPKPELEGHVEPEGSAATTSTLTPQPKVTPHSVAFDAMDPTMSSHQAAYNRASTTRFEWFRRAFGTGKAVGTAPRYAAHTGPPTTSEPSYSPPWLLMAPASVKQEEERMLQNLNDSFRAVGLIPNPKIRPPYSPGQKPKKPKPRSPIIDNIPRDAMMMLMPLWVSEGGSAGGVAKHHVPMAERTYLLVYYVPFDNNSRGSNSRTSAGSKKRSRRDRDRLDRKKSMAVTASERALLSPPEEESTTSAEAPPPPKKKKTSFRVVARMLTYADVRECGIKLPRFGLAVHGSLSDALLGNPTYHAMGDDFSAVVAICHGEDAGVELITEGLDKLGLRMSKNALADEQQIALAAMRMDAGAMKEEYEARQQPLTPIGRSVVEMIFAGCVSILDVGFR